MLNVCAQLCRQVGTVFYREWHLYRKRMRDMIISYWFIQPLSFAGGQGYIKPLMYFGLPLGRKAMMVFGGSLIMYFVFRTFSFATAFFYDIHQQRQIQYQAQMVPLWTIYSVRVLFSAFFTWFFMIPMMPIAKMILRHNMYTQDTSWAMFGIVLALVALMMSSYAFMCVCAVSSMYGIQKIRTRLNEILMWMGAFNAPWIIMYESGKIWGVIGLFNPFTYGTEAIRQAVVPGTDIMPHWVTLPALFMWSILFLIIGYFLCARQVWTGFYRPNAAPAVLPADQ